ncbi:hypothetical protein AVEN_173450-1 [Araneus ventricosus]|uniref:Uncharacterized protein n=1 Tax=Araneus ventricosus TaxID=182803 RepID=A0A4Y2RJZ9_ARAVE|nr:hypothetical protein AVEN_81520-1 [Araneus ventricosus]GBN76129.1 hypothetical protein AVEN_173450-1 [Araneus ventricosus]
MPSEDKFQYLIQAITPGTRAASLIENFPPTAQNYPKAIELLKERFGREDLPVQVYVRELLKMVMKNAANERKCADLTTLYDQLVTSTSIRYTGQRSLENLMDFLRQEVNGEEMMSLALSGFGCQGKVKRDVANSMRNDIPSASALIYATQERIKCVFCSNFHPSQDCGKATTMTREE